jgi:hypothetical protein
VVERYRILKFRGYFCGFSEARDLSGIIFQIPGAFVKICGLRVDIQEVQRPFCKVVEIKEFPDLIYNGKFRGPSPRCGGPAVRSGPWWTAGARHMGTRAHRSSPAGRNRERGNTGNSMGCSPRHGRQ